jgi:hypothetical protein
VGQWSVRHLEAQVRTPAQGAREVSSDLSRVEKELEEHLGTAVRLQGSMRRGWLRLRYSSPEVLQALYDRLAGPTSPR